MAAGLKDMLPLTMLAAQKVSELLTEGAALQQEIATLSNACGISIPALNSSQVLLSSAPQNIGDKDIQLTYPRLCIHSSGLKNNQLEKFKSLSGSLAMSADIWVSGNFITDIDRWTHFYVEAATNLLRKSIGDWGDGVFFPGLYEVQFQSPTTGGLGFVQMVRITFNLNVSRN